MPKTRFSRRDILRYGGAAGLFLLPILEQRSAVAAAGDPRLVLFYFPNGPAQHPDQHFFPAAGRNWTGRSTEVFGTTSPVLGTPYSDQITLVKPLWLNRGWGFGDAGNQQEVGQHTDGAAALFTGAELKWIRNNYTSAGGKSLDQHIVEETNVSRLLVGESPSDTREYRASWAAADAPNHPIASPLDAYQEILPALMAACGAEDTGADRLAQEQKLMFQSLYPEFRSAERTFGLSAEERLKFARYEEALIRIEQGVVNTGVTCVDGQVPELSSNDTSSKEKRIELHIEILGLALAMGVHRVGMLQIDHPYANGNYSFLDGVQDTAHHSMQHNNKASETRLITAYHMQKFASLLDTLASYEEGGANVLDNSVVMMGSDVPDGENHLFTEPHVMALAGGGSGRLRRGVDINEEHNHVDLLATVSEIAGADSTHFQGLPGFGSLIDGIRA